MKNLKNCIKKKKIFLNYINKNIYKSILFVPNCVKNGIIIGKSSRNNLYIKKNIKKRIIFCIKNHIKAGFNVEIIDLYKGAKVSMSKFAFLKNEGALLNRILLQYMIDFHIFHGDKEINVPILVNEKSLLGTGQIPKFKKDLFLFINKKKLFLIPTAEVPLTSYYMNEIIKSKSPFRIFSYSPCFRLEAGASGKIAKGIIRMHQFEKVEMLKIIHKKNLDFEKKTMINRVCLILKNLNIPYRIVRLCSGDLGFSSEETYDIDVWIPSIKKFCEISSCSSFSTFQSKRANIQYISDINKNTLYVSTFNGSGLPLGRTLTSLLENNQLTNGNIFIPKCLINYTQGLSKIYTKYFFK
jgi:seryl-tRNA synthetase